MPSRTDRKIDETLKVTADVSVDSNTSLAGTDPQASAIDRRGQNAVFRDCKSIGMVRYQRVIGLLLKS